MLGWQIASPNGKIQCSRQRFSDENELDLTRPCISYQRIHSRSSPHSRTRSTTKRPKSKRSSLFHHWSRGSILYKLHQKRYTWRNWYEYRKVWKYLISITFQNPIGDRLSLKLCKTDKWASLAKACNREDNLKDDVFCHFFWSSKTTAGGYAYFTTSEEGVKVEYIESDYDKIIYETLIPPRF